MSHKWIQLMCMHFVQSFGQVTEFIFQVCCKKSTNIKPVFFNKRDFWMHRAISWCWKVLSDYSILDEGASDWRIICISRVWGDDWTPALVRPIWHKYFYVHHTYFLQKKRYRHILHERAAVAKEETNNVYQPITFSIHKRMQFLLFDKPNRLNFD